MKKTCPKCGFENPDFMKFCGECGTQLVDKRLTSELRDIGIIFVDMVGFTPFSENKDPEEVREVLNKYWKLLSEIVDKYDCQINKFIGDAALILAGYPRAHENDAERAVLIAYEFLESIECINILNKLDRQFRVGINFGRVYAGETNPSMAGDDTVLGDAVNTAERLQRSADPDSICVSSSVKELTKTFFNYKTLGKVKVKGKEEELEIFKFISKKKERGRFRGVEGIHIPLIGRDTELEELLDRFDMVFARHKPYVSVLLGQAGIGKSRLTMEFLNTLRIQYPNDLVIIKGRCLPYGKQFANWPIIEMFKTVMDIKDGDQSELVREKVNNFMFELFKTPQIGFIEVEDIVLKLLGMDTGSHLSPEAFKNQLIAVLEAILKKYADTKKTVIIIEDLHWMDFSSASIMGELMSRLYSSELFFLFITRPEFRESTVGLNFIKTLDLRGEESKFIELKNLTREETRVMVELILEIEKLPLELKELIIKHSEGNPFYTEEIIKSLIDRNVLVKKGDHWVATCELSEVEIPKTVQAVIQTRIDTLSGDDKLLLQNAAVIGKVFWKKLVSDIFPEIKEHQFDALLDKNLIERDISSSDVYMEQYKFKHILIQEVLYSSILKKIKKELHLKIAGWIEEHFKESLEYYYDLLAYHYDKGEDNENAIKYFFLAGEKAANNYANTEAVLLLRSAYDKTVLPGVSSPYSARAYQTLGDVYTRTGENGLALDIYEETFKITYDEKFRRKIKKSMGEVLQRMSRYDEALASHMELLREIPEENFEERHSISMAMIWIYYLQGDIARTGEMLDGLEKKVSAMPDQVIREKLFEQMYNMLAIYYNHIGDSARSLEYYKKAIELNEKNEKIESLGVVYNNIAGHYSMMGDYKECLDYYNKSLNIAEKTGDRLSQAITLYNLGETYSSLARFDEALDHLEKYMEINKRINNELGFGYGNMGIGTVYFNKGDFKEALDYYGRSAEMFGKLGSKQFKRTALKRKLAALIMLGRFDEAERDMSVLKKERSSESEFLLYEAMMEGERGNNARAVDLFGKIYEEYSKEGNVEELPALLKQYYKYAKNLSDHAKMEEIKGKMADAVERITINIPPLFDKSFREFYKLD